MGAQTVGWDTVACVIDDAVHHDVQVAGVYPYLTNNEASREQKFLSRLVRTSWVVMLAGAS